MLLQQFGLPKSLIPTVIQPSQRSSNLFGLTRREHQVLKLIVQRLTYGEVAGQLEISANTVKFHIKNIYSKLNVNSRLMAVKRANQKRLL
jgi:DNA-binding CsgD family transcriptional regulator